MTKDKDITFNVYFSSEDRDRIKYPSPSSFVIDLPYTLTQIHGLSIMHFKFVPEKLINYNNNTFTFTAIGNTSVSGTITIDKGNFDSNIVNLLAEINIQLLPYNVHFTIDDTTKYVTVVIQKGSFNTSSFTINPCTILDILGFTKYTQLVVTSSATTVATNSYNMINDTTLILQIKDLNTVCSVNQYAHRSTAVLFCANCKDTKIEQSSKDYAALSQVQYRLKQLNVNLLNVYGHPYDLTEYNASFMIKFFCTPANLGDARVAMQKLDTKLDPRIDN